MSCFENCCGRTADEPPSIAILAKRRSRCPPYVGPDCDVLFTGHVGPAASADWIDDTAQASDAAEAWAFVVPELDAARAEHSGSESGQRPVDSLGGALHRSADLSSVIEVGHLDSIRPYALIRCDPVCVSEPILVRIGFPWAGA